MEVGVELVIESSVGLELLELPAQFHGAREPFARLLQSARARAQALLVLLQRGLTLTQLRLRRLHKAAGVLQLRLAPLGASGRGSLFG